MEIIATDQILQKLNQKQPPISLLEVEEAWFFHSGKVLVDSRARHKTKPETVWFISETASGRLLKVVIIPLKSEGIAVLRTAYDPSYEEILDYESKQ